MAKKNNDEIKMETLEKIGVISQNGTATTELRLMSWNDGEPKYDIRPFWTDDKGVEKAGKGIRLTKDELTVLAKLIKNIK